MATSPINGLTGANAGVGIGQVQGVQATPPATTGAQDTTGADDAVSVDTFPSTPPADVMAAIGTASAAGDQLAANGMQVSFGSDEQGNLQIQLQDQDGNTLSSLNPSDVLSIAEGNIPDPTG